MINDRKLWRSPLSSVLHHPFNMSEASGSRPRPNKKNGKPQKKLNGAKMKRLTEKQQIEALEKRAMSFVSIPLSEIGKVLILHRNL